MRIVFLLAVLGIIIPSAHAGVMENATVSLCADDTLNCTDSHRLCLEDGGDKSCGHCGSGFVEDFSSDDADAACIAIEDITPEKFRAAFGEALKLHGIDNITDDRIELILEVADFISEHNSQVPPPDYELRLNHLSALTNEEHEKRNGALVDPDTEEGLEFLHELDGGARQSPPESVDWSQKNAVTSIKNQGSCGGCWSIAIAGALEGAAAIDSDL
jgi:hypothetical protein